MHLDHGFILLMNKDAIKIRKMNKLTLNCRLWILSKGLNDFRSIEREDFLWNWEINLGLTLSAGVLIVLESAFSSIDPGLTKVKGA